MIKKLELKNDVYAALFGSFDGNAKEIERAFGIRIMTADGGLQLIGAQEQTELAQTLIENAVKVIESGGGVDKEKILRFIALVKEGRSDEILPLEKDVKVVTAGGRKIKCLTAGQRDYSKAIDEHTLTFAIGPAGSGKTYLAVAAAVTAFRRGDVKRIVLTRPALEAGERLGFLPGDLKEKADPYLTPLYDALKEMFGTETYAKLTERGTIEIAPLAYMRGRTLNEAFIILDEAQNTTKEQMRMFLTRLGVGSKCVVTGDITQIDLSDKQSSGLTEAVNVLDKVEDVAVCRLKGSDVVRSPIVRKILKAYEQAGKMPPSDGEK